MGKQSLSCIDGGIINENNLSGDQFPRTDPPTQQSYS